MRTPIILRAYKLEAYKLELRGHAYNPAHAQTQTAARFEDVLAHVTFTGTGVKDSRLVPLWTRPEYGTRGIIK